MSSTGCHGKWRKVTFIMKILPFICFNSEMNRLNYLPRMLIAVGLLAIYIIFLCINVNSLLVIVTLPLAVLAQFLYSRSQHCNACGKGLFEANLNLYAYFGGIMYFPLKCPHCRVDLRTTIAQPNHKNV